MAALRTEAMEAAQKAREEAEKRAEERLEAAQEAVAAKVAAAEEGAVRRVEEERRRAAEAEEEAAKRLHALEKGQRTVAKALADAQVRRTSTGWLAQKGMGSAHLRTPFPRRLPGTAGSDR